MFLQSCVAGAHFRAATGADALGLFAEDLKVLNCESAKISANDRMWQLTAFDARESLQIFDDALHGGGTDFLLVRVALARLAQRLHASTSC